MTKRDGGPPVELLGRVLAGAGLRGPVTGIAVLGESSNRVWRVEVAGRRLVVRHRLDGSADLARKEVRLAGLLAEHGVPVPRVLAASFEEPVGLLLEWVEGTGLDVAARADGGAGRLDGAWRSVGEALARAHAIELPVAGELTGDGVAPFDGGWAGWATGFMPELLRWVADRLDLPVSRAAVDDFTARAAESLRDAPVRLIHNDALPQNFLVARDAAGEWRCTAVLDWEFARAGDPAWDLATLDLRGAGLVPRSFYDGYGVRPPEPRSTVHEVLAAAWKTRAQLEGRGDWTWTPLAARRAFLRDLPRLLTLDQRTPGADPPPDGPIC